MPVVENKESSGRTPGRTGPARRTQCTGTDGADKLSPELREAVILRDLQQLDYAEIQQTLAVPEGTVKSRINRGTD